MTHLLGFIASRARDQVSKSFLLVQAAWETLRDDDLRREYDCRVDLQARNVVVSDEVGGRFGQRAWAMSDPSLASKASCCLDVVDIVSRRCHYYILTPIHLVILSIDASYFVKG